MSETRRDESATLHGRSAIRPDVAILVRIHGLAKGKLTGSRPLAYSNSNLNSDLWSERATINRGYRTDED